MKISILVASRHKNNSNMKFAGFLSSLIQNSNGNKDFEVLVKLDDDDTEHPLLRDSWPPCVKTIITPRANGYADLHKSYLDLLAHASSSSELFWVLSDDVEIQQKNWDELLLQHYSPGKPYIINTVSNFHLLTMTRNNALEKCDTYPVWSRNWFAIAGVGYTFATDGWTSMLCHELETKFSVPKNDYRYFVDVKPFRHPDEIIDLQSERWDGTRERQRKNMIEKSLSTQVQGLLYTKAASLAKAIL